MHSNDLNTVVLLIATMIGLIVGVIELVANFRIFEKAGRAGWKSIIPFYYKYVLFEIAGMDGWLFLFLFIPFINIIVALVWSFKLASSFGKSNLFGIGIFLFKIIFIPMLAFGESTYIYLDEENS